MSTFSQIDLAARVNLATKKYTELLDRYIGSIKMGRKCKDEELHKLAVIDIYIKMLDEYIPLVCIDPSNPNIEYNNNCMSEEDIQKVSDKLSRLIGVPFKPIGYQYSNVPGGLRTGIGFMQIGCNFVVS